MEKLKKNMWDMNEDSFQEEKYLPYDDVRHNDVPGKWQICI